MATPPGGDPRLPALNPQQRQVVEHGDGPLLVLAGAGTGKTSALTARLAELVRSGQAQPWQILAVTFTNKAAREMRERVALRLGDDDSLRPEWLGTFHSLSARLLRRNATRAGLEADFTILDRDDSIRLLREVLTELRIDRKQWTPAAVAGWIDRWKNRALAPAEVPEAEAARVADGRGGEIYRAYARRMQALNAVDFGDLILTTLRILQTEADVLAATRRRFRHVLVDEYQDVNVAQYLWLRLVAGDGRHVCCVGDDDQAIYGWRGAEIGHILRFREDFADATVIRLEQNYRSTGHILAVGAGVLRSNRARLGKTLWSELGTGAPVCVAQFPDSDHEGQWIAERIAALAGAAAPVRPREIAILVRAAYLMNVLEQRLTEAGIAYRVVGGPRFLERQEVRDAIAYLQLAARPRAFLAFARVANRPRRGLGPVSIAAVSDLGRERNLSLTAAAAAALAESRLRGPARRELAALVERLEGWQSALAAGEAPAALVGRMLEESGYLDMWRNAPGPEAAGRVENLQEFLNTLDRFPDAAAFLEHAALMDAEEGLPGADRVNLMTIHAAKGLEFDAVFLPGWEDEVFPSPRSLEERDQQGLEEERRIAHVAVTRARRFLSISHAERRLAFGSYQYRTPSRFLTDLPAASIESLTDGVEPALPAASRLEAAAAGGGHYRSPGWSRLQRNRARASDGVASRRTEAAGFRTGARVFHTKFGYGEVKGAEAQHVRVAFGTGVKTVHAAFLAAAPEK